MAGQRSDTLTLALRVLRDPATLAALLGLGSVLLHLPVLRNDFVFDDVPAIVENPVVTGEAPVLDAFRVNFWGGRIGYEHVTTWRPLTTLVFRGTYAVAGANPVAFHAVSLLLHGLVVALVLCFFLLWFERLAVAVAAAALFAVLPVHVEALAGAVNQAELLAAALVLSALCAWLRADRVGGTRRALWLAASLALYALSLLAKEHAVTWPVALGVVLAHRWLVGRRAHRGELRRLPPAWAMAGALAITAVWIAARTHVLPAAFAGDIPVRDNPLVGEDLGVRLLTASALWFRTLRLLVAPLVLTADYSANAIPIVTSILDPDAFAGLLLAIATAAVLVLSWRRAPEVAACVALLLAHYALVSNVLVLSTILLAERLLYLPSVAWCGLFGVAAGTVIPALGSVPKRAFLTICAGCLGLYAARSAVRTTDWRDEVTLFASAVEAYPETARARFNLGRAQLQRGALDDAELHLRAAHRIDPGDEAAPLLLGEVAYQRMSGEQALGWWRRAAELRPTLDAHAAVCRGLVITRRTAEALPMCAHVAQKRPESASAQHFHGLALEQAGRMAEARAALERAAALEPDNPALSRDLTRLRAMDAPGTYSLPSGP